MYNNQQPQFALNFIQIHKLSKIWKLYKHNKLVSIYSIIGFSPIATQLKSIKEPLMKCSNYKLIFKGCSYRSAYLQQSVAVLPFFLWNPIGTKHPILQDDFIHIWDIVCYSRYPHLVFSVSCQTSPTLSLPDWTLDMFVASCNRYYFYPSLAIGSQLWR